MRNGFGGETRRAGTFETPKLRWEDNKCKHSWMPSSQLIFSLEVKIGYMFQPPRWSSSGLTTNVIGRNFWIILKFALTKKDETRRTWLVWLRIGTKGCVLLTR
jgi:hypothetical protein